MKKSQNEQNETSNNNSHSIVMTILEIIVVLIENYFKNKLNQSKSSPGQISRSAINILLVLFVLSALVLSAWVEIQAIIFIYMTAYGVSLIAIFLSLFAVNVCLACVAYYCILKLKDKLIACF